MIGKNIILKDVRKFVDNNFHVDIYVKKNVIILIINRKIVRIDVLKSYSADTNVLEVVVDNVNLVK